MDFKITKQEILECAKKDPSVKELLMRRFPKAFAKVWIDVTEYCTIESDLCPFDPKLMLKDEDLWIGEISVDGLNKDKYRIVGGQVQKFVNWDEG